MAYVPLSRFKAFLNICEDNTSQDEAFTSFLNSAEQVVQNWLGRSLGLATTTEYLYGSGKRHIVLRQRPVNAIVSLYEDFSGHYGYETNAFPESTRLTPGVHYMLDLDTNATLSQSGLVYRIGGNWMELGREFVPGKLTPETSPAYGNIKVTYNHGYATVPDDIIFATCMVASYMKRVISVGGDLRSETLGDYSYRLGGGGLDSKHSIPEIASANAVLARYRECAW